ncbi:MAG TPA: amidohydrolase family protein [Nannocystaceae bacterium]|nr:amidohydrolase family protein [Nannocystaceae bacterium]
MKGGHVLVGDAFVADRAIVVEGDRITAVVPLARLDARPTDVVVDAHDGFVVPGLVDAHGHPPDAEPDDTITMTEYLALCASAGITTIRSCRGTPAQLELRDRIAAGAIAGPRLFVGGLVDATTAKDGAAQVHAAARDGYDFIKLMHCEGEGTYDAIAAAVAETKLPFTGHAPADVTLSRMLAARQSIEHLDGYRRALQAGTSLRELATATADAGVSVCPTETFVERWFQLREPAQWEIAPGVDRVPPRERERWRAWTNERRVSSEEHAAATAANAIDHEIIAALHTGGVNLLASASHGPWIVPGWSLLDELRTFERAGLSRAVVLATATQTTAKFLPGEQPWGRIAPDHRADLVVLSADPLADLSALHRIVGVMTAGHWNESATSAAPPLKR